MAQPLRFSRFEVQQHPDGTPHVLKESADTIIYLGREKDSEVPIVLRVPGPATQRNPAARHRFLEECQDMAQVKHPHLASVLHHGDTTAGAFCAMEFCDGMTLQKAVEEVGPLSWAETLRLALQVSSALEALESGGLVHRGLRSTNLIVTTGEDGHAHLKITEYGRVTEDVIRDTIAATKSGFIQTPTYASPEEFLALAPPDARSLQYALGAVLWFCLTGKPIFTGTQFEVMFQHVNKEPDWSSMKGVPGPVVAVMRRLLAKSAADRFASTAALSAALQGSTTGMNVMAGQAAMLDAPALTGPTALAWLKARQTLHLDEVHPLLKKVAQLLDAAATNGSGPLDASLEKVLIEVENWSSLPDGQRSALLRTPLKGWPLWKVKLSKVGDLPASKRSGDAPTDYVRLCHRLLTGQGKGVARHVPTAALTPEGNAFFEKYLGSDAASALTCIQIYDLLCEAEELTAPREVESVHEDPLATRVVRPKGALGTAAVAPSTSPPTGQQAEQAWLAREREAIERAKRDLSSQEAERARRLAEEQEHVEKLRRSLEVQKNLLEEKRREQQRLEQELQLRAQLEFQKLQEEARLRESQLQHKREAAEQALRQREEDFRAREQARFSRLEELKRENHAIEERVQEEFMTLRHIERRQARLTAPQPAPAVRVPPIPVPGPVPAPLPTQAHPASYHAASPPPAQVPVSRPITTPQAQVAQTHTAGSVVLGRLAPLGVPQNIPQTAGRPLEQEQPASSSGQRAIIMVLMGVLGLGVLALLAAAVLTILLRDSEGDSSGPVEEPFVVVNQPPVDDTPPTPRPGESLAALLKQVALNPEAIPEQRGQAMELTSEIAKLSRAEISASAADLRKAAETWNLAEVWVTLGSLESDESTRLEYFLHAGRLGSTRAQTLAGQILLEQGIRDRHAGAIQQAMAKLSEAATAGDAEAMYILGDAMYNGRGVPANKRDGRSFVQKAAAKGHSPASDWLKKNP